MNDWLHVISLLISSGIVAYAIKSHLEMNTKIAVLEERLNHEIHLLEKLIEKVEEL